MPKLVVHADLHKTGTSYIQARLDDNREELKRNGIHYPFIRGENHHALIAWSRKDMRSAFSRQKEWLDKQFDECETVLLSSEEFSTDLMSLERAEHYKALFRDYETTIVFYLRRQDHHLESVFSQVSHSHYCGSIKGNLPYTFDFQRRLSPSLACFGSSVQVRPYFAGAWHEDDIAIDLLHFSKVSDLTLRDVSERVNESLPRRKTLFLANIDCDSKTKRAVYEVIRLSDSIKDDGIKYCADPDFRRAFYEMHRDSNKAALSGFGFDDVDSFFGYDGQNDEWRPPQPLTPSEKSAVTQDLQNSGLNADRIIASYEKNSEKGL